MCHVWENRDEKFRGVTITLDSLDELRETIDLLEDKKGWKWILWNDLRYILSGWDKK